MILLRCTRAVLWLEITKNRSLLYPGMCKYGPSSLPWTMTQDMRTLLKQVTSTEVRIITNKKASHKSSLVFWLPGLETARHLTRRKLIVVSVRSCDSHCTQGTQLTLPPILSTTIQRSILLSWRSLAGKPVPVPVVVAHLCERHFRLISLVFIPHQRLVAIIRSW